MEERPVWLASTSVIDRRGSIIGTADWSSSRMARMRQQLESTLSGVGDLAAQRLFRMNVTLCMHRALTAEEEAGLGPAFNEAPAIDLAGGPIEVLWENVPSRPSTQPCASPRQQRLISRRPDLWFPIDCGHCEPCRAREAIASYRPANK